MNESTLFRPEVMRAQSERALGDVVVSSSPTVSLFVGAAVLVLLALVLFASLGHYTRKAHVSGYLSPDEGLIKIYAPVTGGGSGGDREPHAAAGQLAHGAAQPGRGRARRAARAAGAGAGARAGGRA